MPAVAIVYRRLRVPLGDLVGLANVTQSADFAGRQLHPERRSVFQRFPGRKRLGQCQFCNVDVLRVIGPFRYDTIHCEVKRIDAPEVTLQRPKHEHFTLPEFLLRQRRLSIFVGIGPKMNPYKFQRIAAVVGVRGRDVAAQCMLGIIQRHRNLMVHGLLEVVRLGNRWFTQKSGCYHSNDEGKCRGSH